MCCALFCHSKCSFFVIPSALFCHSERERGIQYGCFASFSMTSAVSFQVLFFCHSERSFLSFRAHARNPVHGCFASLSMTSAVSFQVLFFCHSERERGIQCDVDASLRLRFAQHDKCGVIPNAVRNPVHGCFTALAAPFSMTSVVSFQVLFFVIPSACEESSAWMLRFAQHDKSGKRGCLTSLSWIGL